MLLILMTSFVFTILEGARIKASEAQLAVLSKMAADSFSAGYCYPLFKEYGLLAVDGGFGKKEKEDGKIKTELSVKVMVTLHQLLRTNSTTELITLTVVQ